MPAPTPDEPTRRRWRAVLTVLVLGMLAMWGYVLYLAFGPGRADPPDRLEDPAFAEAAQDRCDEALDLVAQLPTAAEARDAVDRADTLDVANDHFADMLDDLDGLVELAAPGEDREIVQEWLADWRVYLGDRQAFADALREDEDAELLVTAKGGQQVTDYVDAFAQDNRMPACSTPLDA
jgi:hypothetical protein